MSQVETKVLLTKSLYVSLGLGLIFWIIGIVGTSLTNKIRGEWFYLVFNLFTFIGLLFVLVKDLLQVYKVSVMAFISINFVFSILALQTFIYNTNFQEVDLDSDDKDVQPFDLKSLVATLGYFSLTFVWFFWLMKVGQLTTVEPISNDKSEYGTSLEGMAPSSHYTNTTGFTDTNFKATHILSVNGGSGGMDEFSEQSGPLHAIPPSSGDENEFPKKARALYTYQAKVEDPNELSFTKGEILSVGGNNRGNWWPARNELGKSGIVPSNYLELL